MAKLAKPQDGPSLQPTLQDPQNPEVKCDTPGNRKDYSADAINTKYITGILRKLGAELPGPVNAAHADVGVNTFDLIWERIQQWNTSSAGAAPIREVWKLEGDHHKDGLTQIEAGMAALVRIYNRETGMWRPEPLEGFPWGDYQPSSGFKIISRICGYIGMENFPEDILKTAIDNLLAHKGDLERRVRHLA